MQVTILDNKTGANQLTASAAGAVIDMSNISGTFVLFIDVTAIDGGNQTLDAKIQVSPDNTVWGDLEIAFTSNTKFTPTFTQITAAGQKTLMVAGLLPVKYMRIYYTLAGDEGVWATFYTYIITTTSEEHNLGRIIRSVE